MVLFERNETVSFSPELPSETGCAGFKSLADQNSLALNRKKRANTNSIPSSSHTNRSSTT